MLQTKKRKFKKWIGVDSEYSPTGELLTLGVATKTAAKAAEADDESGLKKAMEIIKGAEGVCGHSIPGDLDYLVKLGIAKEKWLKGIDVRDSFLLARMADENRGKGAYGLEPLLLSEFNTTPWKTETAKLIKKTGNAADWTPEQRKERCRLDSWATVVLSQCFEGKVK